MTDHAPSETRFLPANPLKMNFRQTRRAVNRKRELAAELVGCVKQIGELLDSSERRCLAAGRDLSQGRVGDWLTSEEADRYEALDARHGMLQASLTELEEYLQPAMRRLEASLTRQP